METFKINKREINYNLITVQQAPNLELAKHSFAAQVRVKDVGIGHLLKKLYEAHFIELNTKTLSQVSQDLEEISTEDKFFDLMDTKKSKRLVSIINYLYH